MLSTLKTVFLRSLHNHPVLTNATVYGTLYFAAEMIQQSYKKYFTREKPDYDFKAAARIAGVGSTLYPGVFYYWYRYLDFHYPGKTLRVALIKMFADQLLMTPVLLAIFFMLNSILERKENIFEELQQKYWNTFLASQIFWMPAQTINFYFVPNHLRVVYVATVSFLWINIICYIKRQKIRKVHFKIASIPQVNNMLYVPWYYNCSFLSNNYVI